MYQPPASPLYKVPEDAIEPELMNITNTYICIFHNLIEIFKYIYFN